MYTCTYVYIHMYMYNNIHIYICVVSYIYKKVHIFNSQLIGAVSGFLHPVARLEAVEEAFRSQAWVGCRSFKDQKSR